MSALAILTKCPLAKCPLAKCPLAKCRLAKCPLAKCPDTGMPCGISDGMTLHYSPDTHN